uniref:Secreted protein n=1 Tax=Bursaphelenchus xylophilus TaxID=6326 RepID=A0A1I7SNS2_BURXY
MDYKNGGSRRIPLTLLFSFSSVAAPWINDDGRLCDENAGEVALDVQRVRWSAASVRRAQGVRFQRRQN